MNSDKVNVEEIIQALQQLGGEAQASNIKNKVTQNRGGIPVHYKNRHAFRETIQRIIENYCPQSDNYKNDPIFERVTRGRYKLLRNKFPFNYDP